MGLGGAGLRKFLVEGMLVVLRFEKVEELDPRNIAGGRFMYWFLFSDF